jgi:hypothetical protein
MGLLDDAIREHLDLKRRRGADPTEIERAEREALGPVRRGPEEPVPDSEAEEALAYDHEADYDPEAEHAPYQNGGQLPHDEDAHEEWDEPFADEDDPFAEAGPKRGSHFDLGEPAPGEPGHEPGAGGRADTVAGHMPFDQFDDEPPEHEAEMPAPPPETRRPAPEAAMPAPEPAPPSPPPPPVEEWDEEEPFGDEEPFAEEHPASPAPHPAHPAPPPREPDEHLGQETAEYEVESEFGHEGTREGAKPGKEDVLEETPEFLQDTPEHDRLWFEQRPPRDFDLDG